MTPHPLVAPSRSRSRARRRVAAVLASLAMGAVIVVACSSPNQPPLETSVGGGSSSGLAGGSSSGSVANDSGSSADGGALDGTVGDGGERDADATTPTESGLTQPFDAAGFPKDVNSIDVQVPCGVLNPCDAGCCDKSGMCQPGTANNACGADNHACVDCEAGTCENAVCQ